MSAAAEPGGPLRAPEPGGPLAPGPEGPLAEVALGVPVRGTFHYRIPPEARDLVRRGTVVACPFQRHVVTGYVVATGGPPPPGVSAFKPLREVLEPGEAVPPELFELAEFVADYYLAPLGEVLRTALPSASVRSRLRASITAAGRAVLAAGASAGVTDGAATALGPLDRALLEALAAAGALTPDEAGRRARTATAQARLRRLETDGLVILEAAVSREASTRFERRLALDPAFAPEERAKLLARSARARALVARLEPEAAPLSRDQALRETGADATVVRRLVDLGIVHETRVELERDRAGEGTRPATRRLSDLVLTPEQEAAAGDVRRAIARGGFAPFLLHGVTGSGKTLVYLACLEEALVRGRGALLLVPEIALTPVLARELRGRFGDQVAVLHSALPPGERFDAWRRVRRGGARIVFGARSAVFAPVRDLGVVIVDEEHDSSYKQGDRPHYHARDVAVARAKQAGIPIVLGSATPSLESFENARQGRYARLELAARTAGQRLPDVEIVDLREEFAREGTTVVLSRRLLEELGERLVRREQSLLLLNRRGYASFLVCRECGARIECPDCSVCLAYHRAEARLKCHRCGHRRPVPKACAACSGTFLHLVGHGTEKVEAAVRAALPEARTARLDSDAVRGRDEVAELLARFERGEIDVLVGTQMVAKGHDFPNVTLVGVVSVDALLALPDFRATERTFDLLTQVAGRAGRGDRPGLVVLQTFHPDNEAVKLACLQDYAGFFAREIRLRRLLRYPPTARLVNLIVHGHDPKRVEADAAALAAALREAGGKGVVVLGPAAAPIARIQKRHRSQILMKALDRRVLRAALERARPALDALAAKGQLDVDVDPQDLL